MVTKTEVIECYEEFNFEINEAIVNKTLELCEKYNIGAEDFVEEWQAYAISNLKNAQPTVAYLEQMERKRFAKNEVKRGPIVDTLEPNESIPAPATKIGTPKSNGIAVSRIQTPVQARKLIEESLEISSPGLPTANYSKRTDARSIRCSHGSQSTFKTTSNLQPSIKPLYDDHLKPNQRFMYEVLQKRGKCLDRLTEEIAWAIMEKYKLTEIVREEFELYVKAGDHKKADRTYEEKLADKSRRSIFYGRIVSDSDGKINKDSVLLEETQSYGGESTILSLNEVAGYSLFCGQVVVVKGEFRKAVGEGKRGKVAAKEVMADSNFFMAKDVPLERDTLQLVVACGPFTLQENLAFEPLNDLLIYVKEYQPQVLLLNGPFYDKNHQGIHNGELRQSFDSFFFDLVDSLAREIPQTQIIIVSSLKEPHHFPVYPTPPYEVRQKYPNLVFMSDPCLVNIGGLVVGTTTADILFDIGAFEVNTDRSSTDRMGRLVSYLLKQQHFYPLDPPGKDVYVDMSLMVEHGSMGVKPHVLILPSNLRHFIKEIDGCLVVNPERLTKGNGGGTFARIEISPGHSQSVCGRSACEVLKI